MRTKEQNEQINDYFRQAVKALDDKCDNPDSEVDPLDFFNELERMLIDELIQEQEENK